MNFIRQPWFIWACLIMLCAVAIIAAAKSPLLAWREPIYIIGSFAGVVALVILLYQPLLMTKKTPGIRLSNARLYHRWLGMSLLLAVTVHVVGLWITSPPDVIDALLFRSPTPFAIWGVIAMWAVITSAIITLLRNQLKLKRPLWKWLHRGLAIAIVLGSVVHALMIDGTMEVISKYLLCLAVVVATLFAVTTNRTK